MGLFKSIKKAGKKLVRSSRQGFSTFTSLAAPFTGPWSGAVMKAGQMVAPGDTAESNARKRADFEYARSLADQRAFQDDSVQRRVADARKAGIHPLAALGFNSPSFIPPTTSGGFSSGNTESDLFDLGQDISRAVAAGQTKAEREHTAAMSALELRLATQQVAGVQLDNYLKLAKLVALREKPAFPDVNAVRDVGVRELGTSDGPAFHKMALPGGGVAPVANEELGVSDDPIAYVRAYWDQFTNGGNWFTREADRLRLKGMERYGASMLDDLPPRKAYRRVRPRLRPRKAVGERHVNEYW